MSVGSDDNDDGIARPGRPKRPDAAKPETSETSSGAPSGAAANASAGGPSADERTNADIYGKIIPDAPEPNARPSKPAPQRPGNYLFTVGLPTRGKSTFQRHLVWYLQRGVAGPEHTLTADTSDPVRLARFEKLLLEWDGEFRSGHFPGATSHQDPPTEITLKVESRSAIPNPDLEFGFFEMSGEVFSQIREDIRKQRPVKLNAELEDFLKTSKSNIVFTFLASGMNLEDDDYIFAKFIEHLKKLRGDAFRDRCSIALIISYPEAAKNRILKALTVTRMRQSRQSQLEIEADLRREMAAEAEKYKDDEEGLYNRFISLFFPQTYAQMASWRGKTKKNQARARVFVFSVGQVQENPPATPDNPERNAKLLVPDFRDARTFYYWMYQRFTGHSYDEQPLADAFAAFLRFFRELGTGATESDTPR